MEYRIFEIDERTWRIEEYDENNSVYMYLLTGKRGAALIDTGFGMIDIREVVSTLTKLPVFVINTHGHFDHTGGNPLFDEIHIHPADMEVYRAHSGEKMQKRFPMYTFRQPKENMVAMQDNEVFDLGGRTLRIIHTPGHSVGSVCILDQESRWLFTGDTCCKADVLLNLEFSTTVQEYLRPVIKLQKMASQFDMTWPAHHTVPVKPEILEQFYEAAKQLCSHKAEGIPLSTLFGTAYRLELGDIAIMYTQERVMDQAEN